MDFAVGKFGEYINGGYVFVYLSVNLVKRFFNIFELGPPEG